MNHLYARLQTLGDSEADDAEAAHDAIAEIIRLRTAIADAMELLDSKPIRAEAAYGKLHLALRDSRSHKA